MWAFKWQFWLWKFLDDPSSSLGAKIMSVFIMLVIGLSVISFTLESVPPGCRWFDEFVDVTDEATNLTIQSRNDSPSLLCEEPVPERSPFFEIEYFCIMVFSVEYILRFLCSPAAMGIPKFVIGPMNMIDLLAIAPWYIQKAAGSSGLAGLSVLRVLRLTRVMRIFKMSRNFQGILLLLQTFKKSASALAMLVFFLVMSLIVFATLIYHAEMGVWDQHRQQYVREDGGISPFESIPTSMWWCIVTMTTVGYGDVSPITLAGQLVAVLTMFMGLIVLSLPITIIGANFDELYRDMRKKEAEDKARKKKESADLIAVTPGKPTGLARFTSPLRKAKTGQLTPDDAADGETSTRPEAKPANEGSDQEAPLRKIQALIDLSHKNLIKRVEDLMLEQEGELRRDILKVLVDSTGIDDDESPLINEDANRRLAQDSVSEDMSEKAEAAEA